MAKSFLDKTAELVHKGKILEAKAMIDSVEVVKLDKAHGLLSEVKSSGSSEFFTVEFIKRTTGELRVMNCRFGVTKHLKGGELSFDPVEKGLLIVYEVPVGAPTGGGYRSIPMESIQRLTLRGKTYLVEEGQ
jgi:hypothetical protein